MDESSVGMTTEQLYPKFQSSRNSTRVGRFLERRGRDPYCRVSMTLSAYEVERQVRCCRSVPRRSLMLFSGERGREREGEGGRGRKRGGEGGREGEQQ